MSAYSLITNSSPLEEAGVLFSWSHINVETQTSQGITKQIVKDATGVARPGELVAIMGASGAGKTSLLNALTCRNLDGLEVTGKRFVNNCLVTPDCLTAVSAYVQQDDLFIGTLTVREQLVFQVIIGSICR